ncbi:uncharacterized protein LOC127868541 [Dreissena polymorpha]|uniref:Immunoglobulin subtype domain-containing protein n=1 Tax=Dreissena polymorpha TaxID=45954 RepID=A0A9D4M8A6_DREPO|nr:uncharacterized protein LOC127868541 [Dreissena polymorpha]KAH3871698.1 hypothetical protein DPMN_034909 [Dreissena polymorpha]
MISSSVCPLMAFCLLILFSIHIEGASGSSITSVTNVSIECKSERYGVVFKFQEQKKSDYIRLAECQFGSGGHSQLMDATFKGTYDVTYVNYTCILTILYLTVEQCGMYTCSEMYNESETIVKQIGLNCEDAPRFAVTTESHCTHTTESHCTPTIVVLSVVCAVLAGFGICVHFNLIQKIRERGDFSPGQPIDSQNENPLIRNNGNDVQRANQHMDQRDAEGQDQQDNVRNTTRRLEKKGLGTKLLQTQSSLNQF